VTSSRPSGWVWIWWLARVVTPATVLVHSKLRSGSTAVTVQTMVGILGWLIRTRWPRARSPSPTSSSRSTLDIEGVHCGQRSTSMSSRQTVVAGAVMSVET
jgi:hypothetical protein